MEFLFDPFLGKPLWMWLSFLGLVAALLILDLGILNRKAEVISARQSLTLSALYIAMGLAFGAWVWWSLGAHHGQAYLTGFLIEKTLALDNIFVISLVFGALAIPAQYQHRVLFWGILGVIVLRAIMIGLGATLVSQFGWVLYVFAGFLVLTGVQMLLAPSHAATSMNDSRILAFLRRHMRITDTLHGQRFVVRQNDQRSGRAVLYATPLLLALVMIEAVDLIFAVDSVPAIFAITTDPFIVYTSNIFAILGLRALYFALAAVIDRFKYLKPALALVLIFIGGKVFLADAMGWDKVPAALSLGVTLALLGGGVAYSLLRSRSTEQARA